MKTRKILLITILGVMSFASWSPALATLDRDGGSSSQSTLYFTNRTNAPIVVTLIGPKSTTFVAKPGTTKMALPKGVYTYRFSACGLDVTSTVVLGAGWRSIGIAKCKYVNQLVKNKTGGNLQIKLDSAFIKGQTREDQRVAHLNFRVPPGESRIKAPQGSYNYVVTGCGGKTKTGVIRFQGTRQSWTWECKDGQLTFNNKSK